MRAPLRLTGVLAALALATACGEGAEPTPGPPEPPRPRADAPTRAPQPPAKPSLADGAEIFRIRCATCHGELGDGKGPLSGPLEPKPRDFRDPAWQDSVSDAHIETVVSGGGPSAGLSPIMPAHPDLDPGELAALRSHVRGLRR